MQTCGMLQKSLSGKLLVTVLVTCCACLQRLVTDKGHMVVARKGCTLSFCGAGVLAPQHEASFFDR